MTIGNLQRQFVYDRLLARVFQDCGGNWVLKGGTALLTRVRSARHSKDIDLFRQEGTVDSAVAELQASAAVDLNDYFRFITELDAVREERPGQPNTRLATIKVDGYIGVKRAASFRVDIVVGSILTAAPEPIQPDPVIRVEGLPTPSYLLYPLADHIADKVCATFERFGTAQAPSSRVRDLIDLVVIARTQTVGASALWRAVEAERLHRSLAPITRFTTPPGWATTYAREARGVAECVDHRTYNRALELVGRFLDPVLAGGTLNASWAPDVCRWL